MSRRGDIRAALVSALQGITTGNGYSVTVQSVETVLRGPDEPECKTRPWIGVNQNQDSVTMQPNKIQRRVSTFEMLGYVDATSVATGDSAVDVLEDAVTVAIMSDVTLGGIAINTRIVAVDSHSGDPSMYDFGWLLVTVQVDWCRTVTASV